MLVCLPGQGHAKAMPCQGREQKFHDLDNTHARKTADTLINFCAIAATLTGCGKSWEAVAAICLGMAGVDSPEAQAALTAAIKDWFPPNVGMIVTRSLHDVCHRTAYGANLQKQPTLKGSISCVSP